MKLTNKQLKQLIKEELNTILLEQPKKRKRVGRKMPAITTANVPPRTEPELTDVELSAPRGYQPDPTRRIKGAAPEEVPAVTAKARAGTEKFHVATDIPIEFRNREGTLNVDNVKLKANIANILKAKYQPILNNFGLEYSDVLGFLGNTKLDANFNAQWKENPTGALNVAVENAINKVGKFKAKYSGQFAKGGKPTHDVEIGASRKVGPVDVEGTYGYKTGEGHRASAAAAYKGKWGDLAAKYMYGGKGKHDVATSVMLKPTKGLDLTGRYGYEGGQHRGGGGIKYGKGDYGVSADVDWDKARGATYGLGADVGPVGFSGTYNPKTGEKRGEVRGKWRFEESLEQMIKEELLIILKEGNKAAKTVGDPPYRERGATESQAQQKAAGMALSARRGDTSVSKLKGAALDLYKGEISTKDLRNLAKLGQKVKGHKSKEPKHLKSLPGHVTPAKD